MWTAPSLLSTADTHIMSVNSNLKLNFIKMDLITARQDKHSEELSSTTTWSQRYVCTFWTVNLASDQRAPRNSLYMYWTIYFSSSFCQTEDYTPAQHPWRPVPWIRCSHNPLLTSERSHRILQVLPGSVFSYCPEQQECIPLPSSAGEYPLVVATDT